MPRVKVWNDNIHPFESHFKGDPIRIGAGEYLEMDLFDANDFRGQYHHIKLDSGGLQDPKSYKKIRIEMPGVSKDEPCEESNVCMSCKHKSPSFEELQAHISVRHANATRLELPDEDKALKVKGKKTA